MTRRVLYVAHPLAPTDTEVKAEPYVVTYASDGSLILDTQSAVQERVLRRNLDLALLWLAWLRRSFPQDTFIAPWIAAVLSGADDGNPKLREAGLVDYCAVVERCDGIVLCGPRISSGMAREVDHGRSHGIWISKLERWPVFDLTALGRREPPTELKPDEDRLALDAWYCTWVTP